MNERTPVFRFRPRQVALLALFVKLSMVLQSMIALAASDSRPIRIVAFGDSLTAGYLLPESASFPNQLEAALKARGHDVVVENAGVSGDTTAAGLARFDWSVPEGTDAVILELGANDALRGLDPKLARTNLDAIVTKLKARGIPVLLAGMLAPKSLGSDYAAAFDPIFGDLAKTHDLILYPFFLEGVATDPALNLDDGLHPNKMGVARIVEGIMPKAEELLAKVRQSRAADAKL